MATGSKLPLNQGISQMQLVSIADMTNSDNAGVEVLDKGKTTSATYVKYPKQGFQRGG